MADRNYSGYVPGRGMPTYLLGRAYDESSIDSDGASRIFLNTHPTITTAKDTDSCGTSNISHSLSSFSMLSVDQSTHSNLVSTPNTFQYQSNSLMSSIHDELSDTRTICSETTQNFNEACSVVSDPKPTSDTALPSSISYMDTFYAGPIVLDKVEDYNRNLFSGFNYDSHVYTDSANMFPPYVSILSDAETEPDHHRRVRQPSNGLFYFYKTLDRSVSFAILDEISSIGHEQIIDNHLSNLDLTPPDYNKCCLWESPKVDICGPASRRECYGFYS